MNKKLPNTTYRRTARLKQAVPPQARSLTLAETMMKRDFDVRDAMLALLSATDEVAIAAASLMHVVDPDGAVRARNRMVRAVASRGHFATLAEEIHATARKVRLVEVALAKAGGRVQRRAG